jgi:hypothetical protein
VIGSRSRHASIVARALPRSIVVAATALVACGGASNASAPPAHELAPVHASAPSEPEPLPDTAFRSADEPRVERFQTKHIVEADPPRRYTGTPIDLDVKNADVQEVCRFLADVGHVNIVVASEIQGAVTLRLRHVPWDQALDVVVRVRGLELSRDGDIYLVTPAQHGSGSPPGEKSATSR